MSIQTARRHQRGRGGISYVLDHLNCGIMAAVTDRPMVHWPVLSRLSGWAVHRRITGIITIGMGYYLWDIGLQRAATPVHLIAVLSYFIPIVSVILIGLVLREAMTAFLIPGAALIVLGAAIARK